MKLNAKEAADKLHTSRATIYSLVRNGILTDTHPVDPSKKKHYGKFENKQIMALAKAGFKPRMGPAKLEVVLERFRAIMNERTKSVSHRRAPTFPPNAFKWTPPEPQETDEEPFVPSGNPASVRGALQRQLDRIEAKVDHLVKMWT